MTSLGIIDTTSRFFEPRNRFNSDDSDYSKKLPVCPASDSINTLYRVCQPNDKKPLDFKCGIWEPRIGADSEEWHDVVCTRSCRQVMQTCLRQLWFVNELLKFGVPGFCLDNGVSIHIDHLPIEEAGEYLQKIINSLQGFLIAKNWDKRKKVSGLTEIIGLTYGGLQTFVAAETQRLAEFVGDDALELKDLKGIIKSTGYKGCPQRPTYLGSICRDRIDGILT